MSRARARESPSRPSRTAVNGGRGRRGRGLRIRGAATGELGWIAVAHRGQRGLGAIGVARLFQQELVVVTRAFEVTERAVAARCLPGRFVSRLSIREAPRRLLEQWRGGRATGARACGLRGVQSGRRGAAAAAQRQRFEAPLRFFVAAVAVGGERLFIVAIGRGLAGSRWFRVGGRRGRARRTKRALGLGLAALAALAALLGAVGFPARDDRHALVLALRHAAT